MAKHTLPISLLFLTILATVTAISTDIITKTTNNNFIKTKCSTTMYPASCVQTLAYYSTKIQKSPRQLAQTALTISLSKARLTKTYTAQITQLKGLRPKEVGVVKDCMEEICDVVDRLSKSVHEFQIACRAGPRDFLWRMSNVQTWASAAITDVNTCVDEVKGLNWRVKPGILAQFRGVMECTSNALALVNQFANNY